MLTISGAPRRFCDGLSRREFLRVGGLTVGGLTFADLLRVRAHAASLTATRDKAIIMVYLNGGPSHVDLYDLKPEAPVEYRGEFRPIRTNVPGFDICELMPRQARIADKLAIVRNMQFKQQGHTSPELYTGFVTGNRPSIGSVVSKLRSNAGIVGAMPPHVSTTITSFRACAMSSRSSINRFTPWSRTCTSAGWRKMSPSWSGAKWAAPRESARSAAPRPAATTGRKPGLPCSPAAGCKRAR